MKFRIRSKFVGILVIASLLPLLLGLVAFNWFGRDYYGRAQGVICQTAATQLALSISRSLLHEIELLSQWTQFRQIAKELLALQADHSIPQDTQSIEALDRNWPTLPPDSPQVAATLQNQLALELKEFQKRNPRFAEILVTDRYGHLLAATNKTTDFWQADERWWQKGAATKAGVAYVEGLTFDQSSGSHSIELTLPLFNLESGELAGVLKGIINVMPFLQQFPPTIGYVTTIHEVVSETGEIISRLGDLQLEPFQETSQVATMFNGPGWGEMNLPDIGRAIVGYAPIALNALSREDLRIQGLKPLWAVAYRDEKAAMAPVRARMQLLSLLGAAVAAGFVLVGYQIASKKIIAPLNSLQMAAQAISGTVRLGDQTPGPNQQAVRDSSELLRAVDSIQTEDEIEDLASEFAFMGKRILSYHQRLEAEIDEKTREIRRDLEFARQFQVNLMPRKYPVVNGRTSRASLHFHHYYKAATSMGGDFFNVIKLGDQQAGIFIADVMGHGARSALVTAIIATLLQDLDHSGADPALALTLLNRHFQKVVSNTGEMLFVTAFYLVLDTETMRASYASAGHPSPLLVDRQLGQVVELTPHLKNSPALGLFENHNYQVFTREIHKGDLFLLFTDGLFECVNSDGVQLGREGLKGLVEVHQGANLLEFTNRILHSVRSFTGDREQEDDICLLGVELC